MSARASTRRQSTNDVFCDINGLRTGFFPEDSSVSKARIYAVVKKLREGKQAADLKRFYAFDVSADGSLKGIYIRTTTNSVHPNV